MMIDAPTRVGMPLDEFITDTDERPYELLDGEKVYKMPNGYDHIELSQLMYDALYDYLKAHPFGRVYKEATFVLPDRADSNWVTGSRIPDVMVVSQEKIDRYKANKPDRPGYPFTVIPDLVVEVISPTDVYADVMKKVALYLSDGVRLVWVVDVQGKAVSVHYPDQTAQLITGEGALSGGDVLAGFSLPLAELFKAG